MKNTWYRDRGEADRREREALERAKAELLSKSIHYPRREDFEDSETWYDAIRRYADLEANLVRKYKQLFNVPCETSNQQFPPSSHWTDRT